MTTKYKLYRNEGYHDNDPVHVGTYNTMDKASDALIEKALDAGLMFSEYEIKKMKV